MQMLFQIIRRRVQQGLIEIALDESVGRNIKRVTKVPAMIDADARQTSAGEERITQMRRLRSFRVITDTFSVAARNAPQLRHNFGLENCRRQLTRRRIENHDHFSALAQLELDVSLQQWRNRFAEARK